MAALIAYIYGHTHMLIYTETSIFIDRLMRGKLHVCTFLFTSHISFDSLCRYDPAKHRAKQNLTAPLRKDSFQLWQRSWAVLRITAWTPGVYQFHCHEEQHVALGLMMALNILPSKQPPIPDNVPTEGPCPVWSSNHTKDTAVANKDLMKENERLERRIAMLEEKLQEKEKCVSAK